jgi:toxin FitB
MYLIDTNVISEARCGSPEAAAWFRSINLRDVYLSVITLGEIMRGIALKQKTDPRTASRLAEWLQKLRHDHVDRILAISDQIALESGRIAAMRPRELRVASSFPTRQHHAHRP